MQARYSFEEDPDALAGLRRHLRRLGGGGERGDHVELAAAGDLRAAGDVDRAQLDRRARERADDRRGVAGIGQQPHPGQQVTHLGTLEEGGVADQAVRHGALLERDGDRPPLACGLGDDHGDLTGGDLLPRDQPLDLGGDRLGLGALVLAAPELDLAARRAESVHRSRPAIDRTPPIASAAVTHARGAAV